MDIEEQYDRIFRYCCGKVRNSHAAEDITQETFLRFLENQSYREMGKQMNYLYVIAGNLCRDWYREQAAAPDTTETEPQTEDTVEETGRLELKLALEKLPEDERELLILRYVNGESVADTAKLLNMSRFAVYRRLRTALEHLKEAYDE